jgi:hypothetical protein
MVSANFLWCSTKRACRSARLLICICNRISKTNLLVLSDGDILIWINFVLLINTDPDEE